MPDAKVFSLALCFFAVMLGRVEATTSLMGNFTDWESGVALVTDPQFGGGEYSMITVPGVDGSPASYKFRSSDGSVEWLGAGTAAIKNDSIGQAKKEGLDDLTIDSSSAYIYTFRIVGQDNWWDRDYVVMETAGWPVYISEVSDDAAASGTNQVAVSITLSDSKSAQESVWVRYSLHENFDPSFMIGATGSGTGYSATLPAQPVGTSVYYYVLTSTMPSNAITAHYDLCTLRGNNNEGANFSYTVPPAPPAPVIGDPSGIGQTHFSANWTKSDGATGYLLDVSGDVGFGSFIAGYNSRSVGDVASHTVTNLTAGHMYHYRVRASNGSGISGNSGIKSAQTLTNVTIPTVTTLPATEITTTGGRIWGRITSDGGATVNERRFDWGPGVNWTDWTADVTIAGDDFYFDLTELAPGTTYKYRSWASNSAGWARSEPANFTTAPLTPDVQEASNEAEEYFTANWSASTGATNYFLDVATSDSFDVFVPGYQNRLMGNITFGLVTGLTANSTYHYRVRAQNAGGTSGFSATQAASTAAGPPTYGLRDDDGVNLPFMTYWYAGAPYDNMMEQGHQFNDSNLGNIGAFFIKGAHIRTWKRTGDGGDVTNTTFSHKIWEQNQSEPETYITRSVLFGSDDGEFDGVTIQSWTAFGDEIDVLDGLGNGIYHLKVMFGVQGSGVPGIEFDGPYTMTFSIGSGVTTNSPVPVPFDWIEIYFPAEPDYEDRVMQSAANGRMKVWETYVAGTDPTDPEDAFEAIPVENLTGSENILSWRSIEDRRYSVLSTLDLAAPMTILEADIPPTPPLNIYTDAVNQADTVFYRITVEMPE